jgi:hypothetical protein
MNTTKAFDGIKEIPSINSILENGIDHYNKLKDQSILFNGLTGLAKFSFLTAKFVTTPFVALVKLPGKFILYFFSIIFENFSKFKKIL